MKTIFQFIFVSFIVISTSHAQSLKSFGIKAGGTMATQQWELSTSPSMTTTYRFGPAAGIFVEGFKAGNFGMLGELWYIQKGFSATSTGVSVSPALVYISVPFLLKYRYDDDAITYYCLAGPRIDYLFHIDPQGVSAVTDAMSEGDSDVGVSLGIGMQFFGNVLAEIRYSPSLINAYKTDSLTIKNNSFEFVIGISL